MFNKITRILAISVVSIVLSACNNVPNGSVGVQFNKYGDDRGVDTKVLTPGRYMASWGTDIELMPTFTQTDKWMAHHDSEKDKPNQAISFQIGGGVIVTQDIQISYHIDKENAVKVYQKYKQPIEVISDTNLRSFVRDEFNELGVKYDSEAIQGEGRAKLLNDVQANVIKKAAAIGITVEGLSYLGAPNFPPNVVQSINAKIQATQEAMKVENEVRKTRAEQEKVVVIADARVKVAEADAKSIELMGKAYRDNPQVLQKEIAQMQAEALRDTKIQYLGTMPTMFKGAQ